MTDRKRTGRLSKSRSKVYEREWATAFGVQREAGKQGGESGRSGPDIRARMEFALGATAFAIELKSLLGMKTVSALMDEATREAEEQGEVALLGLELRRPGANQKLIVMERASFLALIDPP